MGVALLTLVFGIVVLVRGHHPPEDPRLAHESLSIARIADVHHLFFTPFSHADLQAARPDLTGTANERLFAQAVQNPELFGEMDHQRQFEALLLAGDPTTYQPLLKHLANTKDFVLAWLDNSALIFRRIGAHAWTESDLTATAGQFQGENQARFLAGASRRLIAIGQLQMAGRALDQAQPHGARLPEYWTALALYDGKINHWKEALDSADRALSLQADFTPALTTKAQILWGSKRFDEALAISDQVVATYPDDPSMLFLHAQISHDARAFDREIAALKHLIEMADAQGISTTGYRVYLGQAYAETGEAVPSLIEFKKVVGAPDASPEQRTFAQDCIDKIGDRTGKR